jgi:hypothetical protein
VTPHQDAERFPIVFVPETLQQLPIAAMGAVGHAGELAQERTQVHIGHARCPPTWNTDHKNNAPTGEKVRFFFGNVE